MNLHARRAGLADVLLAIFLISLLALFLQPTVFAARERSHGSRCANDLRQIALAYVQYGDDKRFLPHMGPTGKLSGDASTSDPVKSVRSILWYGYHDNPEGFICPSSTDLYVPIQNSEVRENMRLWSWSTSKQGGHNTQPPWVHGDDPTLLQTEELSYGMTRRGLNRNVRSTAVLGADRGVRITEDPPKGTLPGDYGNHSDAWNVAKADATVEWIREDFDPGKGNMGPGDWLRSTAKNDPALAISWRADPKHK